MTRIHTPKVALTSLLALMCMMLLSSSAMAQSSRSVTVKKNKRGHVTKKTVVTQSRAHKRGRQVAHHRAPKRVVTRTTTTRPVRPVRQVTRTYVRPARRVIPDYVRTPRVHEVTTCTRIGPVERCVTRPAFPQPDPRLVLTRGPVRRGVTLNLPSTRIRVR